MYADVKALFRCVIITVYWPLHFDTSVTLTFIQGHISHVLTFDGICCSVVAYLSDAAHTHLIFFNNIRSK